MKIFVSLALGFALATPAFADCEQHYKNNKKPVTELIGQPLCRIGYEVFYSAEKKASWYAAEHLIPAEMTKQESRKDDFRPDPELKKGQRAELKDWVGSGLDRGHLAAAEGMRSDKKKLSQSFYLSNIVLQEPSHNQNIWRRLELSIHARVRRGEEAYIITGPIFYGEDERIGKSQVAVPKALFKVVHWPTEVQAWIIPNMPGISKDKLPMYMVPITQVEEKTLIKFQ